jgi:uncharacterized coiled-coil protein SlyX
LETHRSAGAAIFVTEQRTEAGVIECTYPSAPEKITAGLLEPREHLRDWINYGHYGWSSVLWRSDTLKVVKPPYLHVGLPSDVDFQAQIFCRYPVVVVNQVGAVYLVHDGQASRGYDILSVPSWVSLFRRLDRAVLKADLFNADEYIDLRQLLINRYRGIWNRPSAGMTDDRRLMRIAVLAGFRLADWNLAYSLVSRVETVRSITKSGPTKCGSFAFLPIHDGLTNGKEEIGPRPFEGGWSAIMGWLKIDYEMKKTLANDVGALELRLSDRTNETAILRDRLAERTKENANLNERLAEQTNETANLNERLAEQKKKTADLNERLAEQTKETADIRERYLRIRKNVLFKILRELRLIKP